jgi:hypothetical protein
LLKKREAYTTSLVPFEDAWVDSDATTVAAREARQESSPNNCTEKTVARRRFT